MVERISPEYKNLDTNVGLHILLGSGRLVPFVPAIQESFNRAKTKITGIIPITEVDVLVRDSPKRVIPELGVGARVEDLHTVSIAFDPETSDFIDVIKSELEGMIAHELYHVMRARNVGWNKNLLQALINEGLADHFDLEVTGRGPRLWDKALDSQQMLTLRKRAEKEYMSKDYDHRAWFFGSKKEEIPRWSGYSLGFQLVAEYLKKHPGIKPSQLYNVRAEKFIE